MLYSILILCIFNAQSIVFQDMQGEVFVIDDTVHPPDGTLAALEEVDDVLTLVDADGARTNSTPRTRRTRMTTPTPTPRCPCTRSRRTRGATPAPRARTRTRSSAWASRWSWRRSRGTRAWGRRAHSVVFCFVLFSFLFCVLGLPSELKLAFSPFAPISAARSRFYLLTWDTFSFLLLLLPRNAPPVCCTLTYLSTFVVKPLYITHNSKKKNNNRIWHLTPPGKGGGGRE